MWRWLVRIYVAFVLFFLTMFIAIVGAVKVNRLLVLVGIAWLSRVMHAHPLVTIFLVGLIAGQVYLGSNITGRSWFRSKSGLTYEGFMLEKIKPWTWLMVLPISLCILFFVALEESHTVAMVHLSFLELVREATVPNCLAVPLKESYRFTACSTPMALSGSWLASVGYSLGPWTRRVVASIGRPRKASTAEPTA
jgi:hypothetical protein